MEMNPTSSTTLISSGVRGARYQENGDIVSIQGDASIFRAFNNSNALGGALNWLKDAAIQDVYLGGQEWWYHGAPDANSRIDWAVGGGSVCTGYTQQRLNSALAYLDGMFHRKLWVLFGSGHRRIIAGL